MMSILPHPLLGESHIREAVSHREEITFASYMIMTIEVFSERKEVSEASYNFHFYSIVSSNRKNHWLTGAAERPSVEKPR